MEAPSAEEFPGTGPMGNGISTDFHSQADWLRTVKSGTCTACHALGSPGTRTIPEELGTFESSTEAWERRLES